MTKISPLETFFLHGHPKTSYSDLVDLANFDYINPDTRNFFSDENEYLSEVECALLKFERTTTSNEVDSYIESIGYRNASFRDLLLFTIEIPNFQRSVPLVALGSQWHHTNNSCMVPALWGGTDSRELNLCSIGTRWFAGDAFLARRPLPAISLGK